MTRHLDDAVTGPVHDVEMAFIHAAVALALVDHTGRIRRVNAALAELVVRDPCALEGEAVETLIHPEDAERFAVWRSTVVEGQAAADPIEVRVVNTEGRERWTRLEPTVVPQDLGSETQAILQFVDVSERMAAKAALDESERRFHNLVDSLPDPVVRLAVDGSTIFANHAARQMFAVDGQGRVKLEDGVRRETESLIAEAITTSTPRRAEFRMLTRAGHRVLETRFIPEFASDGSPSSILLVATDLTERRRTEAELTYRATHDALTGLPNRTMFATHLDLALARVRRSDNVIAVVFFDLDHFKVVNDSMGHQAGDELLKMVAARLRDQLRGSDVVARLGGDEFTVLLDACADVEQIGATVERLQRALAAPMVIAGREVVVESSAGIAIADRTTTSGDDLLQWADAAMYRAKRSGRSRSSFVDDALVTQVQDRMDTDQTLRGALERQEFEVHYQPEVDLETGHIVGSEALLRWRSEGELLSAAAFIELAEENGQILPIGAWVLETACRQLARWQPRLDGRMFTMRVNLSARQFDQPDLVERVADVLHRTGADPNRLCLEITETALMSEPGAAAVVLGELAALGVHLAIDDFGTGYSSLNYLKRFPVSVLKIDRSFVDGLPEDAEDAVIVSTIIALAGSLGMEVTAEGVETAAQAAELLSQGCRRAQGYLYSPAQPADVLTSLLDRRLPLHSELDETAGSASSPSSQPTNAIGQRESAG